MLDNLCNSAFRLEGKRIRAGEVTSLSMPVADHTVGEAQFKANCYKNYLVRVRKVDPA